MKADHFDSNEAKKFLSDKELKEKEEWETERKKMLQKAITILKEEFKNTSTEVYLVGSLLRPHSFSPRSDIDVVLKGYQGDRFDLWARLEKKMARQVEIILFETCLFQEFVIKEGLKVV